MLDDQSGLTLVELLVVAGLVMVLTAITIPNWNRGGTNLKVIRAAYQLNQDLRRSQELTLANADCRECTNCTSVRGYGLHFDLTSPRSYILFGDCDGDQKYDFGEAKQKINFEEGVELKNINTTGGALTVTFQPPDPTVVIKNVFGDTLNRAELEIGESEFCKRVITNEVGLVEINSISSCP